MPIGLVSVSILFIFSGLEAQAIDYNSLKEDSILKIAVPVAAVILLISFYYAIKAIYIRKKYKIGNWEKHTVEDDDDIKSLADAYDVDWEILAKVNKIKAPFNLKTGEKILVPSHSDGNEEEGDDNIGSDDALQEDSSEIVSGSSIAETLWEEYEKKETSGDLEEIQKETRMEDIKGIGENFSDLKETELAKDVLPPEELEKNEIGDNKKDDERIMEEYLNKKKSKKVWFQIGMALIVLGAVACLAFFLGRLTAEKEKVVIEKEVPAVEEPVVQQESVEETIEDESEREEAPEEDGAVREADFSKTNVLVLNGGSVVGAAGKMKEAIMDADETLKNVEADNAVGEYAGETVIYYQEDFKIEAEKLAEILEESYGKIEAISANDFPEGEIEGNIVIIIGEN